MKKARMIPNDELATLCLELSMLISQGEKAGSALALLAEESAPEDKAMLSAMSQQVISGDPLSKAMVDAGRFPEYVCALVAVSEKSGSMGKALEGLANYYEGRARLDRRVRSALLYPAVMMLLMLVVIAVLLVRVLPIFDDVYSALGGRLTGVAGGLLALGRGLDRAMPVLWALMALAVAFMAAFAALPAFRERLTSLWRRAFGDRGVTRKINDAQLAQALAMGLPSGMPVDQVLWWASTLMKDVPEAQKRCEVCAKELQTAQYLSDAMQASRLLPASACRLLKIGERSGKGNEAIGKIAASLLEESESALEEKVSRVEPALVLVCSILVGLILLSVMLPLMHIMSAIG